MTLPDASVSIHYSNSLSVAVIRFVEKIEILSSCVYNGGPRTADTVMIMQVDPEYISDDPIRDVLRVIDDLALPKETVAFMTAAEVDRVIADVSESYRGRNARAICTAGLSNQVIAGDELLDWDYKHQISQKRREALMKHAGTINVIGIVDRPLNDAAKVNSFIAMTEAKTAGMQDLGWKETGTTSDAIAIISPVGGDRGTYCGTGSDIGIALARSVRAGIRESLIKRGDFPYDMDDAGIQELKRRFC